MLDWVQIKPSETITIKSSETIDTFHKKLKHLFEIAFPP